jgi:1-phosphofructokinase family hexose kinase
LLLTLTINPAIDRTVTVDKLVFEDRGYILGRGEAAGGRGVNASQVLHSFGAQTLALIASGGDAGRRLEASLQEMKLPFESVHVQSESRINLTISDKHGMTVKLNEVGAPITPQELAEIRDLVEARLHHAHWLLICGSLPPGVRPDFYRELIEMAHKRGVKTLLDADGDALLHALEGRPAIITPNQHEAERLLNRALITRSHFLEAGERIRGMGPESVVLSLGNRGALAWTPDGLIEAIPPRIDVVCPIGAGDALAAALVWSLDHKKSFAESLRWGVAAGTAKAGLAGLTFPTLKQTRAMFKQVEVRRLA